MRGIIFCSCGFTFILFEFSVDIAHPLAAIIHRPNIVTGIMTVSCRIRALPTRVPRVNFAFPTVAAATTAAAAPHAEFHEPTSREPSSRFSIFGVYGAPTGVFDAFRVPAADGDLRTTQRIRDD